MKTSKLFIPLVMILVLFTGIVSAQSKMDKATGNAEMKTYVIEREIPKAGEFSMEELVSISQKSCTVLDEMGPQIQWLHSYVTENKIYCVYKATSEDLLLEHAEKGGFPATYITELSTMIGPETAQE